LNWFQVLRRTLFRGAAAEFVKQPLHEQDALQALPVIERDRSALPGPVDRQQRLGARPQRLVDLPRFRYARSASKPETPRHTTSPITRQLETSSYDHGELEVYQGCWTRILI
jgi:hypothetical protein